MGGSAAVLSVSSLYLAVDVLDLPYLPAFVCAFIGVSAFGYAASRRFAFRSTQVGVRSGLARYFGVTTASLLLNSAALVVLVEWCGLRPVIGTLFLAIANAPINFIVHSWLTFRIGRRRTSAGAQLIPGSSRDSGGHEQD